MGYVNRTKVTLLLSVCTLAMVIMGTSTIAASLCHEPQGNGLYADYLSTPHCRKTQSISGHPVRSDGKSLEVYIDPVTGQRSVPSASIAPPTTSPAGLKTTVLPAQVAVPARNPRVYNLGPGKGRAIDMRGSLHKTEAHIDSTGKASRQCDADAPAQSGQ